MTGAPDRPKLMVPMHSDNWALALASGYLGPSLRSDPAIDVQTLAGGSVLAFQGESIPAWAIGYGDDGPRVVLELGSNLPRSDGASGGVILPGLVRTTSVAIAHFGDDDQRRNFMASYSPFPDVPIALVASTTGGFSVDSAAREVPRIDAVPANVDARRAIDYFGGWAGGLFQALLAGKHEFAIQRHLQQPGSTPAQSASSLLLALHPSASALDCAIWETLVEVLSEKAVARGFDKSEVLQEVGSRLETRVDDKKGAQAWLTTSRKVVRAEIDPPQLDDQRGIGQRAALAALLSPDPRSALSLGETLGAGPIVQLLAMVVALLRLRQAAARQPCRHCREQASWGDSGLDQGTARPAAAS